MAKVKSFLIEDDIMLMKDADIEFVSLVNYAANQQPFKIVKGQVKGDNMNKVIYSLLVPKSVGDEKLAELSKEYSFDNKDEESLEDHTIYKQVKDEDIDLETKALAVVDKEAGIYCIVAEKAEKSEVEPIEKEMDYATMDGVGDAAMAMLDIIFGTLRQPEGTTAQRRNAILSAVDNFRKYTEVVLSNSKSTDVMDIKSVKVEGENLKELFIVEEKAEKEEKPEDLEEKFKEYQEKAVASAEEKAQVKVVEGLDSFKDEFETMKKSLNENLNKQFEDYTLKSELEVQLKELKDELEKLKNTSSKRNSELEEKKAAEKKHLKPIKTNRSFVTFA